MIQALSEKDKFKRKIDAANISFCLNPAYDEQNNAVFILKISSDFWELNIQINKEALELVSSIKNARWNEGDSQIIGKCLGFPTFWSRHDGILAIIVGKDDEVWEFGVVMSETAIADLLKEIEYANKKYTINNNKWIS